MTIDMTKTRTSIGRVIDDYGSTITITPLTLTRDKWGDKSESAGTPVATVGISYDYFTSKFNFQPVGEVLEGMFIVIVKYDETIAAQAGEVRYKLTYNSVDYDVMSVEEYEVGDIVLAKQIIAKKKQ
jgi:hypothetical protein